MKIKNYRWSHSTIFDKGHYLWSNTGEKKIQLAFAVEIVLSIANQRSLSKLCFLQRISVRCWIVLSVANEFSLPNCVVSNELVFAAKLCCLQRINFRCRIVLSATNQLHYRIVLSQAEQFLLPNCGVPVNQWISSLMILCFSESVRWWVYVVTNQFVDELCCSESVHWWICVLTNQFRWRVCVISFANEFVFQQISSLMSLHCSKSIRWQVCVSSNQFCGRVHVANFRWQTVCHQRVSFADELHVTRESVSLLNFVSLVKQFCCRFFAADSHVRNDVNAYNDLIVWLCNMWNTWMWACVFLKNIW